MRTLLGAIVALALSAAHSAAPGDADLVIRRARVITLADSVQVATAIATRGERIVYVGDDAGLAAWIGARTRVIDGAGLTVTPGLVDAHGHLHNLGRILREPNLIGTRSKSEAVERVRVYQDRVAAGEWIHGRGWDQNDWSTPEFPHWRDLDATARNPVYLTRVDGHALWVNRSAMELAGITRDTPDPPGGKIVRDERGEPTGVFVDNATELIERHVAPPSATEMDARIQAAVEHCASLGLTGVHDAGTTRPVLESLRRLAARDALPIRVYCMIDSDDPALAREVLAKGPSREADGRITIRCLKLRVDGALGSRGALLLAPYADDPGNIGLCVQTSDTLLAWTRAALAAGFHVGTHAIGDGANRLILDIYQRALGEIRHPDARLRVEHCQLLDPGDIPRFAALHVIASMQPTHATSDMPWAAARVGEGRLRGAYAWKSLLESRAVLAFGSDFPVESADPMTGLYAAVTRQDVEGHPDGGWRAHECITLEEALRAYTAGAAYAAFDEREAGMIRPGMRADLTVLDRDLSAVEPREWLRTRAAYTIVGGRVVYERR